MTGWRSSTYWTIASAVWLVHAMVVGHDYNYATAFLLLGVARILQALDQ